MRVSNPQAPNLDARAAAIGGMGLALFAAMLWGTTGTAQSLAPNVLSSYWVGALRLIVASIFFAAVIAARSSGRPATRALAGLSWPRVLLAGACIAAYNLAFFAGVRASSIAIGTAVAIGSGPIWAGLLQTLLTGRLPALAWWVGASVAVAGVGMLVLSGASDLNASPLGIGLCLGAGLSYAGYVLVNKRLVTDAAPSVATAAVFTTAALLATPAAWALAGPVSISGAGAAVVLYLGVVATGVSYLLFGRALRHISGATGVTLALAEPITAFGLAIVLVGERPQPAALAGLALVLAGLIAVVRAELRSHL
jgi:DME family drug/metabolite transporter